MRWTIWLSHPVISYCFLILICAVGRNLMLTVFFFWSHFQYPDVIQHIYTSSRFHLYYPLIWSTPQSSIRWHFSFFASTLEELHFWRYLFYILIQTSSQCHRHIVGLAWRVLADQGYDSMCGIGALVDLHLLLMELYLCSIHDPEVSVSSDLLLSEPLQGSMWRGLGTGNLPARHLHL